MSEELERAILAGLKRDATLCVLSEHTLRNAARRCAEEALKVVRVEPKERP